MSRKEIYILFIIFIAALAIRIFFIPSPGYEQEILNYKIWSQASVQHGVHNIYDKTWCDIPPVNIYILKGIGHIYRLFSPGFDKNTYLLQSLIKAPAILADLAIALLIFLFVRKKYSFSRSLLFASLFAFNPAVIISSAYWGQMDSVALLFALIATLALAEGKYGFAWALLGLGMLTKVQISVLFPVFLLITWKRKGYRTVFSGLTSSWCVSVLLLLPFLTFHQVDRMIDRIFYSTGGYPYISFVAFNPWWLIRGGTGNWTMDTDLFMRLMSFRTVGTILFAAICALILRYIYYKDKDETAVFVGSSLAALSFFMLLTQMHERYIMVPLIFLLLAAVNDSKYLPAYFVVSFSAFMNVLIAVFWAYPKNFPVPPEMFKHMPADTIICLINITLFLYFLNRITSNIRVKYAGYIVAAVIVIFGAFILVRPSHPVYLSDIAPKIKYQQSGELRMDSNLNGNPLTVNGFKFPKGIGTHAYSSLEYDLGGRFRHLEGMVGVDDSCGGFNRIEAWIYADNKLIYRSGVIQGWAKPNYFYLDIIEAKVLKLIISDGGDGINNDNADWLNVRVVP